MDVQPDVSGGGNLADIAVNGLAEAMRSLGPNSCGSQSTLVGLLGRFGGIMSEAAVARVLGMMAKSLGQPLEHEEGTWNVELFVDILKTSYPTLSWISVVQALDYPEFFIPDVNGFELLVRGIKRGLDIVGGHFPLDLVLGDIWRNPAGQISFLMHAVAASPDVFTFEKSRRKMSLVDGIQHEDSPNQAWLSLDLMELLCKMGDAGHSTAVWKILETPLKTCQEVLLLAMACVRNTWGIVQREICKNLLAACILKYPSTITSLRILWGTRQPEMLQAIVEMHGKDEILMSRVVDVFEGLESLASVLDSAPFGFSLELAAIAYQKNVLDLETWLAEKISNNGIPFLQAMIAFINTRLMSSNQSNGVTTGSILAFFPLLKASLSRLPQEIPQEVVSQVSLMETKAIELQQQQQQQQQQHQQQQIQAAHIDQSGQNEGFKSDIESEANAHFQKIHSEETQLSEVILMLKAYHDSPDQREQEVFACMVHNLFEKYRFFGRYSQTELSITAILMGQLIHHKLVSSITLNMAQRYILDALRKPSDSKMFRFGIDAILQFRSELHEYPDYCLDVIKIPQVREASPVLVEYIEGVLTSDSNGKPTMQMQQPGVSSAPPGMDLNIHEQNGFNMEEIAGLSLEKAEPIPNTGNTVPVVSPEPVLSTPPDMKPDKPPGMPSKDHLPLTLPQKSSPKPPSFTTINATSLASAAREFCEFEDPPEEVSDRIAFIFNNLTTSNLEEKIVKIKETVGDDHKKWLANYMVVKRAAQEANFHHLYIRVVELFGCKDLVRDILKMTAYCVKALLRNDQIGLEMSERTLLKNLGSWLGQLTFANGVAVNEEDLELKYVLHEAYEKGKMVAVLPFMRKLLSHCKGSKEFGYWNPWIMDILKILAEIYHLDGLKMNLTFEIEMIFNDFNLNISNVSESKTMEGRKRVPTNNPDFYDADNRPRLPPPMAVPKPDIPQMQQHSLPERQNVMSPQQLMSAQGFDKNLAHLQAQLARVGMVSPGFQTPMTASPGPMAPSPGPMAPSPVPMGVSPVPLGASPGASPSPQVIPTDDASFLNGLAWNLQQQVSISQPLLALSQMIPLRRLISISIVHAICATINPIVERSVVIACTTTKELVTKDFAMEPDAQRLQKAAHLMVSSLSGSLALVTCKEPLKNSLQAQLKEVLQELLGPNILEQAIAIILRDNLELACNIIKRACSNKSIKEVDKQLLNDYQQRQKAQANGKMFYDLSVYMKGGGRFPAALPQSLKPMPGHLTMEQTLLYDDFAKIPLNHQDLQAGMMESAAAQATAAQLDRPDSLIPPYMTFSLGDQPGQPLEPADPPMGSDSAPTDVNKVDATEVRRLVNDINLDALEEQVATLFDNWAKAIHANGMDKSITTCVEQFIRSGFLKGDDVTSEFFRICAELSVRHCLETEEVNHLQQKGGDGRMSFLMVDSFVKLMVVLLQVLEGGMPGLRKMLGIVIQVLQKDSEEHGAQFNSRPYFRILYGLYEELLPDEDAGVESQEVLAVFTGALLSCRPQKTPGFAFSWLELTSHRRFMPRLLSLPDQQGFAYFRALLLSMLTFLRPYLAKSEMNDSLKLLYKGVMRVMLLLFHDFPDFICEHYLEFCNVIPVNCIQLRNIVLSATPSGMELPDPLKPDAQDELIAGMKQDPIIQPDVGELLPIELKNGVDQYIAVQGPAGFLDMLIPRMLLPQEVAQEEGYSYNVATLNCLVQYTGVMAIQSSLALGASPVRNVPAMDIFKKLATDLDTEGCYLFLNALANQLRFPNSHTHYFSNVIFMLFLEAPHRGVQEQITRLLLERLLAERPHPWGVLVTFMELIENKQYRFWELGITKCDPEIGKLCELVAKTRLQASPAAGVS